MGRQEAFNRSGLSKFLNSVAGRIFRLASGTAFVAAGYLYRDHPIGLLSVAWGALAGYGGYGSEPVYYDYGTTTVYEGDSVYVNGDNLATQEQYATQATQIAAAAETASPPKANEVLPLGVHGMVQGDEKTATQFVQLAINKQGIISGEYYNGTTDQTEKLAGAVDKQTQRAAWTVANRKNIVYETGLANLTKDETTMLIHYGKDKTQQWILVRIPEPQK